MYIVIYLFRQRHRPLSTRVLVKDIMNTIKSEVDKIGKDLTLIRSNNAPGRMYYIEDRLKMHLDNLDADSYITAPEIKKYIKYKNVSLFIRTNNKYFLNGLYPVDLSQYIERLDIKRLANKIVVKKEHIQDFVDFANWWEEVKEIRKKKSEYRKAIKKYYGNPADATMECIAVNYNCSECSNVDTCKLIKTEVTKKQFSKAISLFYGDKQTLGKGSLIAELQELKNKVKKLETQKHELIKEKYELKQNIYDLEQYKKSVLFTDTEIKLFDLFLQGYKQVDIAKELEVTQARVHAIKSKVFRKLKRIKQDGRTNIEL